MIANVCLTQRWFSLVAIAMLLAAFFSAAAPMQAQDSTVPPAQSEELPTQPETRPFDGEIYDPATDDVQPLPSVEGTPEAPNQSVVPESPLSTRTIQGTVAISVSVQPIVRHSEYITYSFSYKNNGNTATTSLSIDTVWNNFRYVENSAAWQYCPLPTTTVTGCGFVKDLAFGPAITVAGNITGGVRYNIATLNPGESGGFTIHLLIYKGAYPTSLPGGADVRRPSASGKIYVNGETAPSSELTATSLIVGPPLRISKTITPNVVLYPLESAPFTITVGNATGSGDSINGQLRADATAATNVIVRDTFPIGSELISAEGSYTINANVITWIIPRLNPGESRSFKVVYKKLDDSAASNSCGKLNNTLFDITSDELPIYNGKRHVLAGKPVDYKVVIPLSIKSVTSNPSSIAYGEETVITIVVQSFWDKPLTAANLQFKLPANAVYVAGTANPALASESPVGQFGSTLTWVFNMPAAPSRLVAVEKIFTLKVRSGYFDTTSVNRGSIWVTPAIGSNVPNTCSPIYFFSLSLKARVNIFMGTDEPESSKYKINGYYVDNGQPFSYIIYVDNTSNQAVVLDKVWAALPGTVGGNFSYVANSSTVNGTLQAPNTIENGIDGTLEWLNIPVAAKSTTLIRFSLIVEGRDYYEYCTRAFGVLGQEKIGYLDEVYICVKINPNVLLSKTADKTEGSPGDEVVFTLSLTNLEDEAYELGLYDKLVQFEFISQISGYGVPTYNPSTRVIQWPLVFVAPGETISAEFIVRISGDVNTCVGGTYYNEIKFYNATTIIGRKTPVRVAVTVIASCRKIEFNHSVERSKVSLIDKFTYTVRVFNKDTSGPSSTVALTDVLPIGFTYVGIDPTSSVTTVPTQTIHANGRVQLNWTLSPIAPSGQKEIKFIVQSGKSIGTYENWFIAAAAGDSTNRCIGSCNVRTLNNTSSTYSLSVVDVQALITIEPSINPSTCVLPNNTVNYKLTLLNTNSHSYPRTTVVISLPLGLKYVSPVGATAAPQTTTNPDGTTIVSWTGINVPAKPVGSFGAQVVLEVTLKVGNVWGDVNTELAATSPAGLIPRKDGAVDTTVKICPQAPSLAKIVVQKVPKIGDQVIYQISVANPNNTALTVTVQDILPTNMSFIGMVAGVAPAQNGNTLTWNLTVPAATSPTGSVVILKFATRVNSGVVYQKYTNTATVTQSSVPFTTSIGGVPINLDTYTLGKPFYLPVVGR